VTNWAFEMTLKMGDIVIARFTNSGQIKEFRGRLVGVTKNYWKIESLELSGRTKHLDGSSESPPSLHATTPRTIEL